MVITSDDLDGITLLKSQLNHHLASSPNGYLLSQSKYASDAIQRARLMDTRPVATPLELNVSYSSSDGDPLPDPSLDRTIVGSLVYLTVTQPDIAYVVHIVSQFVSSPTSVHWAAIVRILCSFEVPCIKVFSSLPLLPLSFELILMVTGLGILLIASLLLASMYF